MPGILGDLARAGHVDAAWKLVQAWGGTKRKVPANPRLGQPLVELIGLEAAQVLAAIYPGEQVDVPNAKSTKALKQHILRATGTTRQIAMELGCTERHVRKVNAEVRAVDPKAPSLFD
ncbi:MAG TPA: hypothetical protein VD995_03140 [Azospirillum sp.]|nr:hypothetical protein [Azospirillum sp.]